MISKGTEAENLLANLLTASKKEDPYLLARITGNFKRGNEKLAKKTKIYVVGCSLFISKKLISFEK